MTRHVSPYIILLVFFIVFLPAKKADARGSGSPLAVNVVPSASVFDTPIAHTATWVPINKVFAKSTKDARAACYAAELYFRMLWHCHGWWGGRCRRQSLSQPNYVWCDRPKEAWDHQQFFSMERYDGQRYLDVWRSARYVSNNGTSPPHLTSGTTKWHLRITGVSGS